MNAAGETANQKPGYMVDTACGSRAPFAADTPYVLFRGEVVYFCCSECKEGYETNPQTSCMAGRMTTGN